MAVRWWGEHDVGQGCARGWHIGPLALHVRCLPREWRVTSREEPGEVHRYAAFDPAPELAAPEGGMLRRFATVPDDQRITLEPVLADRPVVVRPDPALELPPGQSVTFYVSTPAWVRLLAARATPLVAIPVVRPSDTWFGASTMEGQLCYASRTSARLARRSFPSSQAGSTRRFRSETRART